MEIEEDNVVKYTFDESYMPLKALKLTTGKILKKWNASGNFFQPKIP